MKTIQEIHKNWTELGAEDPLWVVLTDPAKRGNKWDETEFLETGRKEIGQLMQKLREMDFKPGGQRALDFGCGAGRLSQALADYFERVDGVDVSASMIEKAKAMNRFAERVRFHLNVRDDLAGFEDSAFDLIYSNIALQHIPPRFQVRYISEFVRLLRPGSGLACFQTIHCVGWRRCVPDGLADLYRKFRARGKAFIPLYGLAPSEVKRALGVHRGVLCHHTCSPYEGWQNRFAVDFYIVSRS